MLKVINYEWCLSHDSVDQLLVFAAIDIHFNYEFKRNSIEPGARFVLSCLSNESDITMAFLGHEQRMKLDCDVTRTTDNQYNCTVVKERFGFSDAGRYQCSVASSDSKHSPRSLSVVFGARPGTLGFIIVIEINLQLLVCFRYFYRSTRTWSPTGF